MSARAFRFRINITTYNLSFMYNTFFMSRKINEYFHFHGPRWMQTAPPLNPRTYIFSVLLCICRTYDDIIGSKLNFFYQEHFLSGILHEIIVDLFNLVYGIVDLFTYFRAFSNIFSDILTVFCRVYIIIPINVGPRNKRGAFSIHLVHWFTLFVLQFGV